MAPLQAGVLVEHSVWGRGKVLAVDHINADTYFPSQAADQAGPFRRVRLTSLTKSGVTSDPELDHIDGKPRATAKRTKKKTT